MLRYKRDDIYDLYFKKIINMDRIQIFKLSNLTNCIQNVTLQAIRPKYHVLHLIKLMQLFLVCSPTLVIITIKNIVKNLKKIFVMKRISGSYTVIVLAVFGRVGQPCGRTFLSALVLLVPCRLSSYICTYLRKSRSNSKKPKPMSLYDSMWSGPPTFPITR